MANPKKTSFKEKTKRFFQNLIPAIKRHIIALGLIAAALGIVPYLASTFSWFKGMNTVEVPDAFPGETWTEASVKKFSWLEGEWFYPTLPDFSSRFKVEGNHLLQQNEGKEPKPFKTDWIEAEVLVSDKGVLRLKYKNKDWPVTFLHVKEGKPNEFYNNERTVEDNGTVTAGHKRLVLKKDKCKVSADGFTYSCE